MLIDDDKPLAVSPDDLDHEQGLKIDNKKVSNDMKKNTKNLITSLLIILVVAIITVSMIYAISVAKGLL